MSHGMLAGLARFVLRHGRVVVVCWLVLLVAGAAGVGRASKRLSFDFSLPGQSGYETAKQIDRIYGNGGTQAPSILVVTVPRGHTVRGDEKTIASAIARVRQEQPELRLVDYATTHDPRFVTHDGRTTFAFAFAPMPRGMGSPDVSKAAALTLAQSLPQGFTSTATGLEQLAEGGSSGGPGILAETLLGALGALAVLAFV